MINQTIFWPMQVTTDLKEYLMLYCHKNKFTCSIVTLLKMVVFRYSELGF